MSTTPAIATTGTERPTPANRRRRVLVSAFAVSPVRGSEPGIGWNIGTRLAKYHDVTLMCVPGIVEPRRQEIEAYLREHGPIPGLTLLFVEETFLSRVLDFSAGPLSSSLLRPLFYFGYASWQRAAYRQARELHAQAPFELSHHLNMLGYREPGYLWKLPIPFCWGPVAGASNLPWPFFRMLSWRDRVAYGLRNIANQIQKRLAGRARKAAHTAAHIWAIGEDNRRMFADFFGVPAECLCESGGKPEPQLASIKSYDPQSEPLRLVYAGLHIGRKGVPVILHAMARVRDEFPVTLNCLGDGPERVKWQALAQQLGIADKVTWPGKVPHAQALAEMAKAHVFAFPSIQEASSTVTLEALSLGLPVVCHDACGMSFVVNSDCGFKVPLRSPETSSEGFATALRQLHRDPAAVTRLSKGALQRSGELSWDYAAQQIAAGYDHVLASRDSANARVG